MVRNRHANRRALLRFGADGGDAADVDLGAGQQQGQGEGVIDVVAEVGVEKDRLADGLGESGGGGEQQHGQGGERARWGGHRLRSGECGGPTQTHYEASHARQRCWKYFGRSFFVASRISWIARRSSFDRWPKSLLVSRPVSTFHSRSRT